MTGVTNELAVGLPPLSVRRKPVWDYYRIEFLQDGYPGRRTEDQVHAHPIYGPYVLNDYISQYLRTGDRQILEAARRVADAAVARMQPFGDALVFQYEPDTGLSSLPESFYSGLTQARYLSSLGKLEAALGEQPYREACEAILRSLTLPAETGGVARQTPGGGLLIEEYSHGVPDYTLNGWTTATLLVHEYATATGSEAAFDVFENSVRGIVDVLPLYDVPELANSRYRLTGPVKVKLSFSQPGGRILNGGATIPGQGSYPLGAGAGKWTNRILRGVDEDGRLTGTHAVLEVLLSRVSWPVPNRVDLDLEVPGGRVALQIGEGPYNPLKVQSLVNSYTIVHKVDLEPGRHRLDVVVPWEPVELAGYPTSFTKTIGGKKFNSYHFIHVETLRKLAALTGDPMIDYYHRRWAEYPKRWPSIPAYSEAGIELKQYDDSEA